MHKSEDHPAYVPTLNKFKAQYHGVERPWTDHYWQTNFAFNYDEHPDIVEPIREEDWMWFRGDRVQVMTGEDKGKQSYICFVAKEEIPLLVTRDIKLVDPSDEQPCDVEWFYTEDGDRKRVSMRTGYIIPVPSQADETIDYKTKKGYKDNKDKDTTA